MSFIQKYDESATTLTHGLVDADLLDVLNPTVPLDSTGEFTRMGVVGIAAWLARGYKEKGTVSFA